MPSPIPHARPRRSGESGPANLSGDPSPDPRLTAYLAGRDEPCPACGYNLRDLTGGRCPECGDAVALRLGLAEPRLGTLVAGLIGLSAGAGLSGLLVVYLFIVSVFRDRMGSMEVSFLVVTLVPFLIEGSAVVVWVRQWPRVRRASRGVRWALVAACWALTLANLLVFSFTIR